MMIPDWAPPTPDSHDPSGRHVTLLVILGGGLAEVPDVPTLVLRIPVFGLLEKLAFVGQRVAHHHARDAQDDFGSIRDHNLVSLGLVLGDNAVDLPCPRGEREERV